MKKTMISALSGALLLSAALGCTAMAEVPVSDVSKAYDSAVDLQDTLNDLDVTVKETTIVPGIKDNTVKTIQLKASGLQDLSKLKVSVSIETAEGTKEQYYENGYFYDNDSGENIKYTMKAEDMLDIMNYYVFLDLNSSSLTSLDCDNGTYSFTATEDSLGTYTDKILEGAQSEHRINLITVQGYVTTNEDNNITKRSIQTVYTIESGETPTTCTMNAINIFHNPGQAVEVTLPDLSSYKEPKAKEPVVEITEKKQTVYATDDLNVRAQNNVSSTVLGGFAAGSAISQTGVTSDGWIQIDFNGTVAYVSADFVSCTQPVITKDMKGTMYATTSVYIRDKAGADGNIIGTLYEGNPVSVSGYTNTNWIRVSYQGHTGYVTQSYLSWDTPVAAMGGTMYADTSAIVRDKASTDGNIIGGLNPGDTIEVTGYTTGNWIRVRYNGSTGYVYGPLLTWDAPSYSDPSDVYVTNPADSSRVKQTFGTVVSCGISSVTLACSNGSTITMQDDEASINCPNGLYNGLYVSAVYYYDTVNKTYVLQALDAM